MGDKIGGGLVHGSTRMGCIKKDDGRGCHVPKEVVKKGGIGTCCEGDNKGRRG